MDFTAEQLARMARTAERSRAHRPPVDRRSILEAGPEDQALQVVVFDSERLLTDRTILYLRIERPGPQRFIATHVDVAQSYLPGVRGTATFRRRPGRPAGVWEFQPGPI